MTGRKDQRLFRVTRNGQRKEDGNTKKRPRGREPTFKVLEDRQDPHGWGQKILQSGSTRPNVKSGEDAEGNPSSTRQTITLRKSGWAKDDAREEKRMEVGLVGGGVTQKREEKNSKRTGR